MELDHTHAVEEVNGRQLVKKHVATIHCSNKLSLLERKISNALLFHASPRLASELVHEIKIDELKRLIAVNTRNHKALKDALRKLISTVMEWNLLGDHVSELDLEGWNSSSILSSVSVNKGIIKYQYSELIKTLLIDPKIYGKINLAIQARFNSSYALALYENCARYRGLPYTKEIDMVIFRKLMGVEEGKYEIFRDFNRRVLNPAVSEINTCSDMRVTPEMTRQGRAIKSIKFRLEERSMKRRIGVQPEKTTKEDMFKTLKTQYGEKSVENAVNYVTNKTSYKKGEVTNMVGYVASAIKNGYGDQKEKPSILNTQHHEKANWILHKLDYFRFVTPEIIQYYLTLANNEQKMMFEDYVVVLDSTSKNVSMSLFYLQKIGRDFRVVLEKIISGDNHVLAFFQEGFSEYLHKTYPFFKMQVTSFQLFMEKV